MRLPLTFPPYTQLRSYGWKVSAIYAAQLDLAIAAERNGALVLSYTWALTRNGQPVEAGTADTRANCIHAAYRSVFAEKQA